MGPIVTNRKIASGNNIEEAINKGNLAIADELIAADYVYHEATAGEKRGRDSFRPAHGPEPGTSMSLCKAS